MGKKSGILGYNMSTKESEELINPSINKTGNRYMAKGTFANGKTGCCILGAEKALAAIEEGRAVKGEGWDGSSPKKDKKEKKNKKK